MAAPFLFGLLLIACVVTAGGDGGARALPHLELPGTLDSARAHVSDAPAPPQVLMDIMSTTGCGRFAALVAATPNVSDVFQQRLVAGGGGLTLFCPNDKAVDAFEPTFRLLPDGVQANVLLQHGAAARYVRAQLTPFEWVAVPTLAVADNATVLVRDRGDSIRLWLGPTWPRVGQATVTKTISSSEAPLVLYVVDGVLVRRQEPDGRDEASACGDLLGFVVPGGAVVLFRYITDVLVPSYRRRRSIRA
nr:fasciclin-like arabinogalactan protein 2 [Lolium perenne]